MFFQQCMTWNGEASRNKFCQRAPLHPSIFTKRLGVHRGDAPKARGVLMVSTVNFTQGEYIFEATRTFDYAPPMEVENGCVSNIVRWFIGSGNHGSNFSVILLFLGQFSHFHGRKGLRAVGLRGQQPFGPWVCVTNDRGNNNPLGFRMFFFEWSEIGKACKWLKIIGFLSYGPLLTTGRGSPCNKPCFCWKMRSILEIRTQWNLHCPPIVRGKFLIATLAVREFLNISLIQI